IKDALAFLRLLVNPDDDVSALRIINVPKRGIGSGSQEQISAAARIRGRPILRALREFGPAELGLTTRAIKAVEQFIELMDELGEPLARGAEPVEILDHVLSQSGYLNAVMTEDPLVAEGRIENLQELRSVASSAPTLEAFLEQTALYNAVDALLEDVGVTLMTVL
ncbi:DNA helicase, UvrD/REP type, partial [mine drainage metagenome]